MQVITTHRSLAMQNFGLRAFITCVCHVDNLGSVLHLPCIYHTFMHLHDDASSLSNKCFT